MDRFVYLSIVSTGSSGPGGARNFSYASILNPNDIPINITDPISGSFMGTSERNNYFYTSNRSFANLTHQHGGLAITGSLTGTSNSGGLSLSIGPYLTTAAQSSHTHSQYVTDRSNAWSNLGVSVGTGSPSSPLLYPEWMAGSTGFWAWLSIDPVGRFMEGVKAGDFYTFSIEPPLALYGEGVAARDMYLPRIWGTVAEAYGVGARESYSTSMV